MTRPAPLLLAAAAAAALLVASAPAARAEAPGPLVPPRRSSRALERPPGARAGGARVGGALGGNGVRTLAGAAVGDAETAAVAGGDVLPPSSAEALNRRGGASDKLPSELAGVLYFAAVEFAVRKFMSSRSIPIPSPLAGCLLLFAATSLVQAARPGWGDAAFDLMSPGAAWLSRWMTVFFVPGLALLPLAPSFGSGLEVVKVLGVVMLGFLYSLSTTTFTVLGLRTLQGAVVSPPPAATEEKPVAPAAPAPAPARPFSPETLDRLVKGAVLFGAVSIAATRANYGLKTPLQTIFMIFTTVASYVWGARLPPGFNKVVHPLITCVALTLLAVRLTGAATGSSFEDVLGAFKVGSIDITKAGAGDLLLYMLGPTVTSFSVAMYSRRKLMAENLLIVGASMLVAAVGGLFGTAFFVKLIKLGGDSGKVLRLSVIPRNVTVALAIAISNIIGGDISITASVVVMTGILGAMFGARILDAMGIRDPVSRGLGIGASSQGLGVASLVGEKDAFPFAAVSMVMTAVAATCLVSVPAVKDLLIGIVEDAPKVVEAAAEAAG